MAIGNTGTRPRAKITPDTPGSAGALKHRHTRLMAWGIMAALTAILLVACGGSPGASTAPGGAETPNTEGAPDFPISFYQGEDKLPVSVTSLADLRGQPVVLNFWAGLCPPCRAEIPDLQEFAVEFEGKAVLLGIDVGQFTGLGNEEDAKKLLAELGATYPAGSTDDRTVMQKYRVLSMPTTVFIDAEGNIFRKWSGALNRKILTDVTNEMLSQ